jgi:hypothetical protein
MQSDTPTTCVRGGKAIKSVSHCREYGDSTTMSAMGRYANVTSYTPPNPPLHDTSLKHVLTTQPRPIIKKLRKCMRCNLDVVKERSRSFANVLLSFRDFSNPSSTWKSGNYRASAVTAFLEDRHLQPKNEPKPRKSIRVPCIRDESSVHRILRRDWEALYQDRSGRLMRVPELPGQTSRIQICHPGDCERDRIGSSLASHVLARSTTRRLYAHGLSSRR